MSHIGTAIEKQRRTVTETKLMEDWLVQVLRTYDKVRSKRGAGGCTNKGKPCRQPFTNKHSHALEANHTNVPDDIQKRVWREERNCLSGI